MTFTSPVQRASEGIQRDLRRELETAPDGLRRDDTDLRLLDVILWTAARAGQG